MWSTTWRRLFKSWPHTFDKIRMPIWKVCILRTSKYIRLQYWSPIQNFRIEIQSRKERSNMFFDTSQYSSSASALMAEDNDFEDGTMVSSDPMYAFWKWRFTSDTFKCSIILANAWKPAGTVSELTDERGILKWTRNRNHPHSQVHPWP